MKNSPFKFWKSLSRITKFELLIFCFYFIVQFPGRVGADANTAMNLMRNDSSTANWTQIYFWFLKILTFNGTYIALASGLGYALFMFAVHFTVRSIWSSANYFSETTYLILLAIPIFGVYGMTLDHNLQANTGNLILLGILMKLLRRELLTKRLYILSFVAILLSTMSFIGTATAVGFVVVLVLTRQSLRLASFFAGLTVLIILFGNALPVEPRALGFKYTTVLQDIRCLVPNENVKISKEDLDFLATLGPLSIWKEPISCVTAESAEFVRLNVNESNEKSVQRVWLNLFRDNPRYILLAHLQRASVALPPGISLPQPNGYETDLLVPLGQNTPRWLHLWNGVVDDSRYQTEKIQSQPAILKYLQYGVIFPTIIMNNASYIWGWGGLWLLISAFIAIRHWGRKGLLPLLPIAIAHAFLFIMIPTPDPRYTLLATTMGFLMLTIRKKPIEYRPW